MKEDATMLKARYAKYDYVLYQMGRA